MSLVSSRPREVTGDYLTNIKTQPFVTIVDALDSAPVTLGTKLQTLKSQLSVGATIVEQYDASAQRWSTFDAPSPGAVVSVKTEEDIATTVKWAGMNKVPFLAQSGAHGFSYKLAKLGKDGIVINLRALNQVNVDLPNGTATIGGGAITKEVLDAAHEAKSHAITTLCSSVGVVPALIGGGLGNLTSLYGLGVDNMLSARVVTAAGEIVTASANENQDLWWGLRGAGHNLGIVSQLTVKAYEQINDGMHFAGTIGFPASVDMVQTVVETLQAMGMKSGMGCTMTWARMAPELHPALLLNIWYGGAEDAARKAFKPLLDLKPTFEQLASVPYPAINDVNDFVGLKNGNRKPCFGIGLSSLCAKSMRLVFEEWETLTRENPDTSASVVLTECYGMEKAQEVPDMETAFAWREKSFQVLACAEYTNPALDAVAKEYGNNVRDILTEDGQERNVYVNFATGDESPKMLYGNDERVARLGELKDKWDPEGLFSFYHPVK